MVVNALFTGHGARFTFRSFSVASLNTVKGRKTHHTIPASYPISSFLILLNEMNFRTVNLNVKIHGPHELYEPVKAIDPFIIYRFSQA